MVLPLSVLLASIMSFGDLSEHYEFAAMKSAGISLNRAMRPIIYFILGLTVLSFWFTNNISPKSEYKFVNLKQEIVHSKPAMAISAGQFNDIENFNIRVEKKFGDNGQFLKDVTMHIKSKDGLKNKTVIKADSGKLETSAADGMLKLYLYDGNYYEDVNQKKANFVKTSFENYVMNIDLSNLSQDEENLNEIKNTEKMLEMSKLLKAIDTFNTINKDEHKAFIEYNNSIINSKEVNKNNSLIVYEKDLNKDSFKNLKKSDKINIYSNAISNTDNMISTIDNRMFNQKENQKLQNRYMLGLYDKFVIAFSCLLMFFIGAPLGAIIRKGGLGLPMVIAVLIFITYHFINTFGKRLAQEDGISAFWGSWLSTIALLPLAIIFTYKASKDRGINSIDNIMYPVVQLFKKYFKKEKKQTN